MLTNDKRIIDATIPELLSSFELKFSEMFRPDGKPDPSEEAAILSAVSIIKLAPDQANEFLYQMRGTKYDAFKDTFAQWCKDFRIINYGTGGMLARYCPKELLEAFDALSQKNKVLILQDKIRRKQIDRLNSVTDKKQIA